MPDDPSQGMTPAEWDAFERAIVEQKHWPHYVKPPRHDATPGQPCGYCGADDHAVPECPVLAEFQRTVKRNLAHTDDSPAPLILLTLVLLAMMFMLGLLVGTLAGLAWGELP